MLLSAQHSRKREKNFFSTIFAVVAGAREKLSTSARRRLEARGSKELESDWLRLFPADSLRRRRRPDNTVCSANECLPAAVRGERRSRRSEKTSCFRLDEPLRLLSAESCLRSKSNFARLFHPSCCTDHCSLFFKRRPPQTNTGPKHKGRASSGERTNERTKRLLQRPGACLPGLGLSLELYPGPPHLHAAVAAAASRFTRPLFAA